MDKKKIIMISSSVGALFLVLAVFLAFSGKEPSPEEILIKQAEEQGFNPCQQALTHLEKDGKCEFKPSIYAGKAVAIARLDALPESSVLAFESGEVALISTPLYFSPEVALKAYLKKNFDITLTDKEIAKLQTEVRLSRRGYLIGFIFKNKYSGEIYINPQGQLSGKVSQN